MKELKVRIEVIASDDVELEKKEPGVNNEYGDDSIKKEKCFAWFPVLMDDGKTVWLNHYTKVYRYEEHERWIRFASRLRGQFYKTTGWNLIETYQ